MPEKDWREGIEDALEKAAEPVWSVAEGEVSHWNRIAEGFYPGTLEPANNAGLVLSICAIADAAEVQKWVAIAGALKDSVPPPLDVEWPDYDYRELLKRCAEIIWKHEARPCDMMALADHSQIEKLAEDLRGALFP